MSAVVRQIEAIIAEHALLAEGASALVAVSGGLDSMVLLHILHRLAAAHRWKMVCGHFNHQLRGKESDDDEEFVKNASQALGLRIRVGRGNVKLFAKEHDVSIEMAARELRHQFFARTAKSLRIRTIALAHQKDDQVELFFLRLLRGAGPEGLSGMKWKSPSPADPATDIVRPLLGMSREILREFASGEEIRFREDSTNHALDYGRNRVRHELLPLLREKFQPALNQIIPRLMELVGAESEFVEELARAAGADEATDFSKLHVALQRRCLKVACQSAGVTPDFDLIERLRSSRGEKVMVDSERVLWRDAGGYVHLERPVRIAFQATKKLIKLTEPRGQCAFSGTQLSWNFKARSDLPGSWRKPAPGSEMFDADKIGASVCLRHWRPGDRFQPIGMRASVKLQDLFTNMKIPRAQRRELVLAATPHNEIFWVEGLRISEKFKIDPKTERYLEWHWERSGKQPSGQP